MIVKIEMMILLLALLLLTPSVEAACKHFYSSEVGPLQVEEADPGDARCVEGMVLRSAEGDQRFCVTKEESGTKHDDVERCHSLHCCECNCGEARDITGDSKQTEEEQETEWAEYPWVVYIIASVNTTHDKEYTGALLDRSHVLTAGHIFDHGVTADRVSVQLGSNKKVHPLVTHAEVARVDIHPSYLSLDLNGSDVAVLTLTSPVTYSHRIKPGTVHKLHHSKTIYNLFVFCEKLRVRMYILTNLVCLPSNAAADYVGQVGLAVGFGRARDGSFQDKLTEFPTTIISNEGCKERIIMNYNNTVTVKNNTRKMKIVSDDHHICTESNMHNTSKDNINIVRSA